DEQAAERRVDGQVQALGAVGIGAVFGEEPRDVRPDETLGGDRRPVRARRLMFVERGGDGDEARGEAKDAQAIHLPGKPQIAALVGLGQQLWTIIPSSSARPGTANAARDLPSAAASRMPRARPTPRAARCRADRSTRRCRPRTRSNTAATPAETPRAARAHAGCRTPS